jgi:hypothetical protein
MHETGQAREEVGDGANNQSVDVGEMQAVLEAVEPPAARHNYRAHAAPYFDILGTALHTQAAEDQRNGRTPSCIDGGGGGLHAQSGVKPLPRAMQILAFWRSEPAVVRFILLRAQKRVKCDGAH